MSGVGGISSHRLRPVTLVFQADVPSGSWWISLPDRLGPIKNQRCGGDFSSPSSSVKMSYLKNLGGWYSGIMSLA